MSRKNSWFKGSDKKHIAWNFSDNYMRTKKNNSGHIYVLKCGKYHKIGRAKYLAKRISAYNTHSPYEIEVVKTILVEDCVQFEKLLHMTFSNFKHRGEWYYLTFGSLSALKEVIKLYE